MGLPELSGSHGPARLGGRRAEHRPGAGGGGEACPLRSSPARGKGPPERVAGFPL